MDSNLETGQPDSQSSSSDQPALDDHQDLKCPLCLDLFVDPCYVCSNHHTLCRACYQGVLNSSPMHQSARCPQCRDRLSRPVENSHMRDLIEAVRQLHRRQQQVQAREETEQPIQLNCKAVGLEGDTCQKRAFSRCGHCGLDLCDLHFSEHRIHFQTACQRQLQSASAILQVAERQEAALAAWDSLIDRLQQVAEQRRTRLRAASRPALSETMATAMQQSADQLRAALDSGDLRAAAAARDRLATTEEAAMAAVTVAESSLTQQLAPPPPQLNKRLLEVEFANLLDEAEYLYRGFRGGHPSGTLRRYHKTERRRKFESVRATDLTVVTLGDQTRHGRRPMWRGPKTGLRWPTQDEEENASQTAVDFESLEAGSLPASNRSPWRPLPSTVLYCKSPNSRQLLVLESVSGCHLATVELTAASPHLVERLAYWPAKQQLLLSNGKSVLQCDLTGVCHRRLDGFRDATDVCLDLNGDRLLVLESRLGCVFVYGLEKFAPLQTLGPFGRGLHSMCWVSGATGQSLPALLLTDRLGPIRIFAGSNKLVPIRELTPELHTAAAEAATPSWPSSFTAAAVSPAGDQVYIATPSSGIFCLPYSRLLNNQDEQESGVSSTGFELLISAAELNHRAPAGMEILQLTSACDNAGLEQSAAGFELLVCSGDASEIDVFHLTTTAVQLDYVDEGDGGFNPM